MRGDGSGTDRTTDSKVRMAPSYSARSGWLKPSQPPVAPNVLVLFSSGPWRRSTTWPPLGGSRVGHWRAPRQPSASLQPHRSHQRSLGRRLGRLSAGLMPGETDLAEVADRSIWTIATRSSAHGSIEERRILRREGSVRERPRRHQPRPLRCDPRSISRCLPREHRPLYGSCLDRSRSR